VVHRERMAVSVDAGRSDPLQSLAAVSNCAALPILETLVHVVRILCYDITRPTGLG
jgi:hypothetical protein